MTNTKVNNHSKSNPNDLTNVTVTQQNNNLYPYSAVCTSFASYPITKSNYNTTCDDYKFEIMCILGGYDSTNNETDVKQLNCKISHKYLSKLNSNYNYNYNFNTNNGNGASTGDTGSVDLINFKNMKMTVDDEVKECKNSDLKKIGLDRGCRVLSFFIPNHKKYGDCFYVVNTNGVCDYHKNGDIVLGVYIANQDR